MPAIDPMTYSAQRDNDDEKGCREDERGGVHAHDKAAKVPMVHVVPKARRRQPTKACGPSRSGNKW